jgi:hypothetical protein
MSHLFTTITNEAHELIARSPILSNLQHRSYTRLQLLRIALEATILALLIPAAYRDYQAYLALGPGGPPYNVMGWLGVKLFFNPLRREMFGTRIYDQKIAGGDDSGFLAEQELPPRKGERPAMADFAVPQRQINQVPGRVIQEVPTAFTGKPLP